MSKNSKPTTVGYGLATPVFWIIYIFTEVAVTFIYALFPPEAYSVYGFSDTVTFFSNIISPILAVYSIYKILREYGLKTAKINSIVAGIFSTLSGLGMFAYGNKFVGVSYVLKVGLLILAYSIYENKFKELCEDNIKEDEAIQNRNIKPEIKQLSLMDLSEDDFSFICYNEGIEQNSILHETLSKAEIEQGHEFAEIIKNVISEEFMDYKYEIIKTAAQESIGSINPYNGEKINTFSDYISYLKSSFEEKYKESIGTTNLFTKSQIKTFDDYRLMVDFLQFDDFVKSNPDFIKSCEQKSSDIYKDCNATETEINENIVKENIVKENIVKENKANQGLDEESEIKDYTLREYKSEVLNSNCEPRNKKFVSIILTLFLILSVGVNIYQGVTYNSLVQDNKQLQNSIEEQKEIVNDKNDQINSLKSEIRFYENNAVFVTGQGEKYHKYDCQYMQGKEYWILNISAAQGKGYEPCSKCFPEKNKDSTMDEYMQSMIDQAKN